MDISKKKISINIGKIVNALTIKKENTIYAEPHINGRVDCFDLINCNADNCLKTLNYFIKNNNKIKTKIYIEVYDESRIPVLNNYVKSINNPLVEVEFLPSCWGNAGISKIEKLKRYILNQHTRHKCKVLLCDTGWAHFFDKIKSQIAIDLNYGASIKQGNLKDNNINFEHFDYVCETSMMSARVFVSEKRAYYENMVFNGFSRNDTIGHTDKLDAVNNWLKANNCLDKKIIVFVPTFRPDYIDYNNKNIFGFEDNGELDKLLEQYNAVLVTKLHPIQREHLSELPKGIINFEPNYDFTIYDLFNKTDILISDYSSISTDFLLAHRPVIYLFADYDEYDSSRGFVYEPIQNMCCGDVVYTWDEMKKSLQYNLTHPLEEDELYKNKFDFWFKYDDFNACERNYNMLLEALNK